jgi:hypothetical protein
MPKAKRKQQNKQSKGRRDFAQTAFSVFQQATGGKQAKPRYSAQRHSRSGRGK